MPNRKPLSSSSLQWLLVHQQLLLVFMLAALHLRLMLFIPAPYGRIPLLLHFAIFLLWQPFISAQSRVGTPHLIWIALGILIAVLGVSWSLLALWLVLLAGIVGGRVFYFSQRKTKAFYLMALAYLIIMLLFQVMPKIIPESIDGAPLLSSLASYAGMLLIVAMALLPEGGEQDVRREAIDLVYSLFVILIVGVLVLGTTSLMLVQKTGYIQALLSVIFGSAAILLAASWLWNPTAGISRLGAIASRYMLSIGLPFEHWLRSLAELAESEEDPDRFLDRACSSLVQQLPWVIGCTWSTGASSKDTDTGNDDGTIKTVFRQGELCLTLQTQQPLPPVVVWHFNLVTQLVARFHIEKRGDRQLREMAYIQAVHETGARVTHDVKNLLQSLHALLFVVDGEENNGGLSAKAQPLLRRQLPLIAQRLQQTLEKLQVPDDARPEPAKAARLWWDELRTRYEGQEIRFDLRGNANRSLPVALFSSAAENFLQNAIEKRALEPDIQISVLLDLETAPPAMIVKDTGSALAADKARNIGLRPLPSDNGLGIGLYQLARQANNAGYLLALDSNEAGNVSFSLRPGNQAA